GYYTGVVAFARTTFELIRDTWRAFVDDNLSRDAAAIAYYAIFAIAPLLVVITEIVALLLGGTDTNELTRVLQPFAATLGSKGVAALRDLITTTLDQSREQGLAAAIVGLLVTLYAATGLLGAVQTALDEVWDVPRQKRPWYATLHDRFIAFLLIAA